MTRPRWLRVVRDQPTPGQLRQMFPQLPWSDLTIPDASGQFLTHEETRWSLRGEPRTRATFHLPHPADFPGGLPKPPEYPDMPAPSPL